MDGECSGRGLRRGWQSSWMILAVVCQMCPAALMLVPGFPLWPWHQHTHMVVLQCMAVSNWWEDRAKTCFVCFEGFHVPNAWHLLLMFGTC